jgi:hypothetical protein
MDRPIPRGGLRARDLVIYGETFKFPANEKEQRQSDG